MIYKNIRKEEFKKLMEKSGVILLDVRTKEEYDVDHIDDAILIDYYESDFENKIDDLDRDKTYLVYCRSGKRSRGAMSLMEEYGFREVYNLEGGILAFRK